MLGMKIELGGTSDILEEVMAVKIKEERTKSVLECGPNWLNTAAAQVCLAGLESS